MEKLAAVAAPFLKAREHAVHRGEIPAAGPRGHGEVFLDRQRGEDFALLGHPANARERAAVGGQARDVDAIQYDASAG